ncbi:MAG: hypothetical protein HFG25_11845 [Lachnospiraceae bacterium]|nr:hypothetical protein [Lachnospiraceae bacterium]
MKKTRLTALILTGIFAASTLGCGNQQPQEGNAPMATARMRMNPAKDTN